MRHDIHKVLLKNISIVQNFAFCQFLVYILYQSHCIYIIVILFLFVSSFGNFKLIRSKWNTCLCTDLWLCFYFQLGFPVWVEHQYEWVGGNSTEYWTVTPPTHALRWWELSHGSPTGGRWTKVAWACYVKNYRYVW